MRELKAKKSLGQNFLHNQDVLHKIIEAGEVTKNDLVVEIGPGKGALTEHLIKHAGKVIAVEKDPRLVPFLHTMFTSSAQLEITEGDALQYQPPKEPYKIIANIPYYITSPLLTHFLLEQYEQNNLPQLIVLLIQKEVAQRICHPNRNSVLSLSVKIFGTPELIAIVPPSAFKPAPKVDSAIIKISNIQAPLVDNPRKLIKLIKMASSSPRKKLVNNLAAALHKEKPEIEALLKKLQIDSTVRAEKLELEEWMKLFKEIERVL